MEELPGANLRDLVKRSRWGIGSGGDRDHLRRAVRKSGEWLRRFHEIGDEGKKARLDTARILDDLRDELERCADLGLGRDLAARVAEFVGRALPVLAKNELPVTHVHGDFKLDNVVASDRVVGAVDIALTFVNVVYYDIASFCNSIALIKLDPHGFLMPARFLAELKRDFLAGYFRGDGPPSGTIELFQLMGMPSKHIYIGSTRAWRHLLVRRNVNRFFARHATRLLAEAGSNE
jgi:hypothetical protein